MSMPAAAMENGTKASPSPTVQIPAKHLPHARWWRHSNEPEIKHSCPQGAYILGAKPLVGLQDRVMVTPKPELHSDPDHTAPVGLLSRAGALGTLCLDELR